MRLLCSTSGKTNPIQRLVLAVEPGSTADKAGLRGTKQVRAGLILGNIIPAVNNTPVSDYNSVRDDRRLTLSVTLEAQ